MHEVRLLSTLGGKTGAGGKGGGKEGHFFSSLGSIS